jgi:release factor glutamine methyltransferase
VAETENSQKKDWTLLEVLQWTTGRFSQRGIASARLDAELLLAFALGINRVAIYTSADRLLAREELANIRAVIERRQAGQSVAAITGRKEFWGLELHVGPDVLIPRPDTETLVEAALDQLAPLRKDLPPESVPTDERILDVATGSGAIALALKKQRPHATVVASDRSPKALAIARGNSERLRLGIEFYEGDLLHALPPGTAPFDLITANLPYIPTADIAGLPPEVRAEPHEALDGGIDGLDLVRRLVAEAPGQLKPGGSLVLELGEGQADAVSTLLLESGFSQVGTRADLGGIARVVFGRKGNNP